MYITFNKALKEIPKSGEVWCEGARLALSSHPANRHFNFINAERHLEFAIQFTPQYGDSFLECMRLYLMTNQMEKMRALKQTCIHSEPNYGVMWFFFKDSMVENAM